MLTAPGYVRCIADRREAVCSHIRDDPPPYSQNFIQVRRKGKEERQETKALPTLSPASAPAPVLALPVARRTDGTQRPHHQGSALTAPRAAVSFTPAQKAKKKEVTEQQHRKFNPQQAFLEEEAGEEGFSLPAVKSFVTESRVQSHHLQVSAHCAQLG
ncbi:hypothetical protein H920_11304 [Fukomys damarensis]|uniref:Uncharacterized protein n=1 Tax=Fukomys damarensis TaxID=885580 RepID=A0A091D5D2_FUKDA|nr:hypothetical protein H920_11304 [Fukomys damarensis]